MTFNDAILKLIEQNSGGMKITQLITDMMMILQDGKQIEDIDIDVDLPQFLNDRLAELKAAGKIGILTYSFPMGSVVRQKEFIHFP